MSRSIIIAFTLLATSVSAQVQSSTDVTSSTDGAPVLSAQEVAAQASQLAGTIKAQIGDRVNTASAADLEGFIIFTVDQGTYPDEVVEGALDILAQTATGNFATAIENARKALRLKRRGTGAILPNGGGLGGGTSGFGGDFPAPGVGTGGGGVDYTS